MHKLTELKIWQKAKELALEVYQVTAAFPDEEKYGLTSQIKRSAISIPSNIAEGAGRNSDKEFSYFLSIANGSSYELQTQLMLAEGLLLIPSDTLEPLLLKLIEIQKMNYAFQNKLNNKVKN